MKLTVIGSTGSMSGPNGAASSYLLQAQGWDEECSCTRTWSILMDVGPGAFGQLQRYMDPNDLDAVFVSHGHADHLGDIISMHVYFRWHPDGGRRHVPVIGPAEIPARVAQIDGYAKEETDVFDYQVATPGAVFTVGPFTVTAFAGYHVVETYGFRVVGPSEEGSETAVFAYTGDTDLCDEMVEMATDADLLLAECGFTEADQNPGVHMSGKRVGQLAKRARVKKTILTHIQPWTDPEVPVKEFVGQDAGTPDLATAGATWEF